MGSLDMTSAPVFAAVMRDAGVYAPVAEHRFAPPRRWRFDFAWPDDRIAVELEGVVWRGKGRHQTAKGYAADCEKYNRAALLGWIVLRFTQSQHGEIAGAVREALTLRRGLANG